MNTMTLKTPTSQCKKKVFNVPLSPRLRCSTIDLLDWNSLINDTTKISNLLMVPSLEVSCCHVTVFTGVGVGQNSVCVAAGGLGRWSMLSDGATNKL